MPDPTKATVSATQMSALLGVSTYLTKWMLYMEFTGQAQRDDTSSRMDWGKKMQPIILEQVANDQKLVVTPNGDDSYIRRGLLGCTRDATIWCPNRGPGALEIKCVFDYAVWMQKWGGGNNVPREYEIQLQQQMYVGEGEVGGLRPDGEGYIVLNDGKIKSYEWGLIAVWVCADLYYFERAPIYDLWNHFDHEATEFLSQVNGLNPPPKPFGNPIELRYLSELLPVNHGIGPLDLSGDYNHVKTSSDAAMYKDYKEQESGYKTSAEAIKTRLLAIAGQHSKVLLPCGVEVKISKAGKTGKKVEVYVPEYPTAPPPAPDTGALIG